MNTYSLTTPDTSSETVEHTSSVADGESVRPRKAHKQQKEDCTGVPGAASKHYVHCYMHTNWRSYSIGYHCVNWGNNSISLYLKLG